MSEPYLGQIQAFGFSFAPRGWATCDGQLLPIAQNSALFSLLGTTYGGDGRTTFALPDLRGRVSVHVGTGPGLSPYSWGQQAGTENVTLTSAQMAGGFPAVAVSAGSGDTDNPAGKFLAKPIDGSGSAIAAYNGSGGGGNLAGVSQGGGQGHTNIQPYLAIYWCIALQGIFPSRN